MDFDEVCLRNEVGDFWPESQQGAFQIALPDVAQSNPDDFRRRTFQHQPIKKISIPRENDPIILAGVTPELQVGGALA